MHIQSQNFLFVENSLKCHPRCLFFWFNSCKPHCINMCLCIDMPYYWFISIGHYLIDVNLLRIPSVDTWSNWVYFVLFCFFRPDYHDILLWYLEYGVCFCRQLLLTCPYAFVVLKIKISCLLIPDNVYRFIFAVGLWKYDEVQMFTIIRRNKNYCFNVMALLQLYSCNAYRNNIQAMKSLQFPRLHDSLCDISVYVNHPLFVFDHQ